MLAQFPGDHVTEETQPWKLCQSRSAEVSVRGRVMDSDPDPQKSIPESRYYVKLILQAILIANIKYLLQI